MSAATARGILLDLYETAVDAASPGRAVKRALAADPFPTARSAPVHLLALGKAAHPMAAAAAGVLAERGAEPAGGAVVAPDDGRRPTRASRWPWGATPSPTRGPRRPRRGSARRWPRRAGDEVWVLLSGGASSLAAAPVDGVAATTSPRSAGSSSARGSTSRR
jgi:glycerate-2-kinase